MNQVLANARPDSASVVRVTIGDVCIDRAVRRVTRGDIHIELTTMEFNTLALVASHKGDVATYPTLLRALYGKDDAPYIGTIKVFISHVRRKLRAAGVDGWSIDSVSSLGYRINAEPTVHYVVTCSPFAPAEQPRLVRG